MKRSMLNSLNLAALAAVAISVPPPHRRDEWGEDPAEVAGYRPQVYDPFPYPQSRHNNIAGTADPVKKAKRKAQKKARMQTRRK